MSIQYIIYYIVQYKYLNVTEFYPKTREIRVKMSSDFFVKISENHLNVFGVCEKNEIAYVDNLTDLLSLLANFNLIIYKITIHSNKKTITRTQEINILHSTLNEASIFLSNGLLFFQAGLVNFQEYHFVCFQFHASRVVFVRYDFLCVMIFAKSQQCYSYTSNYAVLVFDGEYQY